MTNAELLHGWGSEQLVSGGSAPSPRGDQARLPCGALSIRHTERASLLDPSTILLRSPACILSNGARGVPVVTSAIFSSNLTIRFPIFSLTSIVMLANSLAERAFLRTDPAEANWPRSCRS